MRILYVNHYAGSPTLGMEFRPHTLAREWNAAGHETLLVGSSFSHLRQRQPPSRRFLARRTQEDGVQALWLPCNAYRGNGFGRILNMLLFLFGLFLRTFAFVRWKPHVVVASSTYPLDIFPCWLIARLAGAKLVHEVHDLWPLSPMELGGLSPRNPYIMVMQCAENFACRSADAVVSILPAAKAHLVQHGMAPEKFIHVPNGILLSEWPENPPPSAHDALLRSWKEEGLFLAGYVGGHGVSNALETMVDAAAFFANQPVAFVFVGKGPEKERLRARAESLASRTAGTLRIHFLDAVPKAQIPSLLSHFDILCHTCDRKSIYRFGISPNKTFDYMMSGRPILQALEAGNDLVKEASCGWSVPPEDPAAFAQGLREARDAGAAEQARRGANGKRFVLANHTFGELSRRFLAAFSIDSKR